MDSKEPGDTVFVHELEVETTIGIWDWERKIRQTVRIDLDIGADVRSAAEKDDIDTALDYKAIAKRVQEFVGESDFQLVETLAERIAELVLDEFETPWIRVRVSKPRAISGANDVGVLIHRTKA